MYIRCFHNRMFLIVVNPSWALTVYLRTNVHSTLYWERKKIKDVIAEALSSYLQDRDVEPIPEGW